MYILPPTLFAFCVVPLKEVNIYDTAYKLVSDYRKQKIDRIRLLKDKQLSLGAELLLHYALEWAGLKNIPEAFIYSEQGKPFLKDSKLWFNLSHSGNWVVCTVADCEVGCDVEKITEIDMKIAKKFFRENEYEQIVLQSLETSRRDLFFRYWTLKESFMKATGLGMKLLSNNFEIQIGEEISISQTLDNRNYCFSEYTEIPGYCCAICTIGKQPDNSVHFVDLNMILGVYE